MIHYTHRFHGRSSLRFVYQRGQAVRGNCLQLRYVRNPRQNGYRVAVVVSRKVSKSAVVRNRIRRRLYELVRAHASKIQEPYDLVFIVYDESVATMEPEALKRTVQGLLQKADVLSSSSPESPDHAIVETKEKTT